MYATLSICSSYISQHTHAYFDEICCQIHQILIMLATVNSNNSDYHSDLACFTQHEVFCTVLWAGSDCCATQVKSVRWIERERIRQRRMGKRGETLFRGESAALLLLARTAGSHFQPQAEKDCRTLMYQHQKAACCAF